MDYNNSKRQKQKKFAVAIIAILFTVSNLIVSFSPAHAAAFTEFSIRPSRVEVSITDVNFLIKANAITVELKMGYRSHLGLATLWTVHQQISLCLQQVFQVGTQNALIPGQE